MKILSLEQIRELDQFTIEEKPITSIELMERAATLCVEYLLKHSFLIENKTIKVFVGRGNNGGDGLVIARQLAEKGYSVFVYCVRTINKHTSNFLYNRERLEKQNKVTIIDIDSSDDIPQLYENDVVIDAILGSGLKRPAETPISDLIEHINKMAYKVIALDIPSGMYCDKSSMKHQRSVIRADITLTFLPVKLAFLFQENYALCGAIKLLDIGLSASFINNAEVTNYIIEPEIIATHLKRREKFCNKHDYGHALIIAGKYGMFGAAALAVGGALRSGAGLVTAHIAKRGTDIMQISHPEALLSIDAHDEHFSGIQQLESYNAIGVGSGLGKDTETATALKLLIQNFNKAIVFDADAINLLAENPTWLGFIPKYCIFTPHLKEFERLVGKSEDDFERNRKQREFSQRYDAYVVLKGAHTAITCPDGSCYFNIVSSTGLATAGSGDVLTGIITGLLAQKYHPKLAAIIGVYLHGMAGCIATEKFGEEAMLAGDIVKFLGKAFLKTRKLVK
jgi:NAD(P)H-hydrate epimerase